MSTRLYLPSAGTSPLPSLTVASTWWAHSGASFFRAPLVTEKSNSALTTSVSRFPDTDTDRLCFAQFVSAPLAEEAAFLSSDVISGGVRCGEAHTNLEAWLTVCVRAVSGDGSTETGILFSKNHIGLEMNGSVYITNLGSRFLDSPSYCNSLVIPLGDRLVVEWGASGGSLTNYDVRLRFGDPVGSIDLSSGFGDKDTSAPWLELTKTLVFEAGSSVVRSVGAGIGSGISSGIT